MNFGAKAEGCTRLAYKLRLQFLFLFFSLRSVSNQTDQPPFCGLLVIKAPKNVPLPRKRSSTGLDSGLNGKRKEDGHGSI